MSKSKGFNFFTMFRDGFKSMTLGRTLWIIVVLKLCIMFLILRPFFFPNFLNSKFEDKDSKADYVRQELIERVDSLNVGSFGNRK